MIIDLLTSGRVISSLIGSENMRVLEWLIWELQYLLGRFCGRHESQTINL